MVYFIIVFVIITLDLISKYYIKKNYKINSLKEIIKNKVYINHVKNTGIAYSGFSKYTNIIAVFSSVAVTALFVCMIKSIKKNSLKGLNFSLALLLGGAMGNLYERIRYKSVTDFIYIKGKKFPVFNIADIFITIGGILLIMFNIKEK